MLHSSFMTITPALKKAVDRYYKELAEYVGRAEHETAIRSAFQNLLAEFARSVNWTLIPEKTLENGKRPDATFEDNAYWLKRGYWEAKDTKDDLEKEIRKKISENYPLTNIIFEDSRRAVLYQNKKRVAEFDLTKRDELIDLLRLFFSHTEPEHETFETAVQEFKERIPDLAKRILSILEDEQKKNKPFIDAFASFATLCRASINPNLSDAAIKEMLIQHILTVRLFRTVFNNPDFTSRNVIASEIEKVIRALTSRSFSLTDFLKPLDRFYVAIEAAAKNMDSWTERQRFLNTVYERFFQGFAIKQADTYGIVYTPQEIVDFMVASVEEVLQREFQTSLAEPGVQILDPATGTGSFIVNILHRIPRSKLRHKYQHDLFCNEIMLLPYYIASLNIEHEYYENMKEYEPFEGISFADTLELAEGQQLSWIVEENTERVQRQKDAQIMVVIGNPPYNVGQKNENDNNKNQEYKIVDKRISETFVKESVASLKTQLYDAYVRFFRWSIDRLGKQDGIVCFVTNNGFLEGIAFDGFRKQLSEEFTHIYHLDLGGNARKGKGGNVFGIMVGVGITILIRQRKGIEKLSQATIHYYTINDEFDRQEKLMFLSKSSNISNIVWQQLQPDERYTWITEGIQQDFTSFLPFGSKQAKSSQSHDLQVIFMFYSSGVKTNRDIWVYDFDSRLLTERIKRFADIYNGDVDRWKRRGLSSITVDDFVTYDDKLIKWSENLKNELKREKYAQVNASHLRKTTYRPFSKKWLYYDATFIDRPGLFKRFFPALESEAENITICVPGLGDRKGFGCLATNTLPGMDLAFEKVQCFPFYTYAEDGSNRRENITDWALRQFQEKYGAQVSKWDIFHYVYAMLHHPVYRARYAENLKRDLPHIPLLKSTTAFETCVRIGKALMELHLRYEQARQYPLKEIENRDVPFSWRVEKMRLTPDKSALIVNESLTLAGIPQACFAYRLGNRSALEWVIDQYQVSTDTRSSIVSDPNNLDDEEYIVRLVRQVITVSVETVRLVEELAEQVTLADWLDDVGA